MHIYIIFLFLGKLRKFSPEEADVFALPLNLSCCVSFAGKSKGLTPQWEIMAKRVSDASRMAASLQEEVHELD